MTAGDEGQASIEHLGLTVLIVLLLLSATAIAEAAGAGLSNRVTTAMQRALCTVGMQDCSTLTREPCPMLRTDRTTGLRVAVGWIRLGDDRAIQIERRSDGTYSVTLLEGIRGGLGATYGAGAMTAEAALLRGADAGRTYVVRGAEAAQRLVRRLRAERLPAVTTLVHGIGDLTNLARTDPGVDAYTLASTAIAEGEIAAGYSDFFEGGLAAVARNQLGLRISTRRPRATAYVQMDGRISAFFDALPHLALSTGRERGGRRVSPNDGETTIELPGIGPAERTAIRSGTIAIELAPGPRIVAVTLTGQQGDGAGAREVHARIDPHDPAVAAALRGWRADPNNPAAIAAIGQAAAATAAVDVREFAVSEDASEYGGQTGAGPSLGVTFGKGISSARLISQRSRPAGGVWERRLECEA